MRKIKITEQQLELLRKGLSEGPDISNIGTDDEIKGQSKTGEIEISGFDKESLTISVEENKVYFTVKTHFNGDNSEETTVLPISKCKEICNFLQKFC